MEFNKDYSNYKTEELMNLSQYKDIKDMERIMIRTQSGFYFKSADESRIEERINKIKRLRKLINLRQKVKDLF